MVHKMYTIKFCYHRMNIDLGSINNNHCNRIQYYEENIEYQLIIIYFKMGGESSCKVDSDEYE